MLAFHSNPNLKFEIIEQLKAHYEADEIVKGYYWENGKGCAVGCIVHSGDHSLFESRLGIPRVIARLIDRIFEGLPNNEAKYFPLKVISSIQVGKDLSYVWPRFAIWLMNEIKLFASKETLALIIRVITAYEKIIGKDTSPKSISHSVADADAADAYAAYAASAADAAYSAYIAARDASDYADAAYSSATAAYAAYSYATAAYAARAADAASYGSEREKFYIKMSEKLISLLLEERE